MALGTDTFNAFGGAVKDIFAGFAAQTAAEGKRLEATSYDEASSFAHDNSLFTATTTGIKEYQANRSLEQSIGGTEADIAGAGFAETGTALDILSDSMNQGAIQKALISQQGAITEQSYDVQSRAYATMAASSRLAADAADTAAIGDFIGGGIKAITGFASL